MLMVIAVFGVLVILGSGYGTAYPQGLLEVIRRFANPAGMAFAVAIRLVLGVAAILAAPASLAPPFLYIVGGVGLLAAIALPLMGIGRYKALIEYFAGMKPSLIRLWLLFGLVFGVALIWVSGVTLD